MPPKTTKAPKAPDAPAPVKAPETPAELVAALLESPPKCPKDGGLVGHTAYIAGWRDAISAVQELTRGATET